MIAPASESPNRLNRGIDQWCFRRYCEGKAASRRRGADCYEKSETSESLSRVWIVEAAAQTPVAAPSSEGHATGHEMCRDQPASQNQGVSCEEWVNRQDGISSERPFWQGPV